MADHLVLGRVARLLGLGEDDLVDDLAIELPVMALLDTTTPAEWRARLGATERERREVMAWRCDLVAEVGALGFEALYAAEVADCNGNDDDATQRLAEEAWRLARRALVERRLLG